MKDMMRKLVVSATALLALPAVSLAGEPVEFRNIKLRELPAKAEH